MITFTGSGISGSVAMGRVYIPGNENRRVKRVTVSDTEAEIRRFEKAKSDTIAELRQIYEKALAEVGETNAQIFEIHQMMVQDEDYNEAIINTVKTRRVCAEYAVAVASENFSEMFAAMEDSYMRERAADVKDISDRIIKHLTGVGNELAEFDDMVICADDLTPSETVLLDKSKVRAFVTAYGSSNSHTAILSRTMNIPAIIGMGEEFLNKISNGDTIIVDGNTGAVYVNPDENTKSEMAEKQQKEAEYKKLLQTLKGQPDITIDGTKVDVYANIGSVSDIGAALANDAGGIGLFRSEFLYLESRDYPTEEQQFKTYKKVLQSMGGKRVIIRTLDIGADKQADYFNLDKEENPALGLRAIRLCLNRPEVFRTQLRALYRASVYGRLGIMFPMIASVYELREALKISESVKRELIAEGWEYSDSVELGIMIETPAAALISDELAELADFFSVGTNDLVQYTLAADRQNSKLEYLSGGDKRAVMKLIEMSVENAHKNNAWIGICGELAADCTLTEQFLRMGIDELSVSPGYVLKVRNTIRNIDLIG